MNASWNVSVYDNKAVGLGSGICCDGFHRASKVRVQTHIHTDHMGGFASSKGNGQILCLSGTHDLLLAKNDSETGRDLRHRSNFKALDSGEIYEAEGARVQLMHSDHMLGSAQVLVEHSDGYRTGYSGDFGWPTQPIEVDELVLDGTSSPATVRNYSQDEAEDALLHLALDKIATGPVVIWADMESIHRGLAVLGAEGNWPILVDNSAARFSEVYAKHGMFVPSYVVSDSSEGLALRAEENYFMFKMKSTKLDEDMEDFAKIHLMPYRTGRDCPVFETFQNYFEVGMSNHADFEQTVEYVSQTGAQRVLVDNSRSPGRAMEVAHALQERLGITASYETQVQGF